MVDQTTLSRSASALSQAAQTLERALATSTRAAPHTVSTDVEAFTSAGASLTVPVPAERWPTVAALRSGVLRGGSNRIPIPQPVAAAAEQAAEKTAIANVSLTYPLATFAPRSFGLHTNLSLQAEVAQEYVEGYMVAAVTLGVDTAVLEELETAATASTSLGEAVAAVNAAGWPIVALIVPPSVIVGDASSYAGLTSLGVQVIADAAATSPLVVAVDGVALIVSGPDVLRQDEAALAGRQVGAWAAFQLSTGAGAVAVVSGP